MNSPKAKFEDGSPTSIDPLRLGAAGPKANADARAAMTTGPPDDYDFYTFKDLVARRIIRDREDLSNRIRDEGFPKPVKMGATRQSRALYSKRAVHAWFDGKVAAMAADAA